MFFDHCVLIHRLVQPTVFELGDGHRLQVLGYHMLQMTMIVAVVVVIVAGLFNMAKEFLVVAMTAHGQNDRTLDIRSEPPLPITDPSVHDLVHV